MDETKLAAALSALRGSVAAAGGIALAFGYLTNGQVSALTSDTVDLVGGIATLAPIVWGAVVQFKAATATKAKVTQAVQAGVNAPVAPGTPISDEHAASLIKQFTSADQSKGP